MFKSTLLLALFTTLSMTQAHAEVSEREKALRARECFRDVSTQVSIGLSMKSHGAEPNSPEEQDAGAKLYGFNKDTREFEVLDEYCNRAYEGEAKFRCYKQYYREEVLHLAQENDALDTLRSSKVCGYKK